MKKLLSLVLAVVLVLSLVTFASAAVTIGGNIRVWWQSSFETPKSGVPQSDNSFKFDRFDLIVNADNGKGFGISDCTEFRNVRIQSDDDKLAMSATSSSAIGGGDLREDYCYIYFKNTLTQGDQWLVGCFDGQYPFKNGYSNITWDGGLADGLKMAIATGVVYQIMQPEWDVAFGVCDAEINTAMDPNPYVANSNDCTNGNGMNAGYDYAFRVNWKPASVSGIKAGIGYQYVAGAREKGGTIELYDVQDNYDTDYVVDCSYSNPNVPYSGMIEYASVTPTRNGSALDAVTGAYVEGAYKVGTVTFVLARAMTLTAYNAATAGTGYGGNIFSGCYNGNGPTTTSDKGAMVFPYVDNSYSCFDIIYPLADNVTLQLECVVQDAGMTGDGNGYISNAADYGIRLRYNF